MEKKISQIPAIIYGESISHGSVQTIMTYVAFSYPNKIFHFPLPCLLCWWVGNVVGQKME